MSSNIGRYIVAGLAAGAVNVSAAPWNWPSSNSVSSDSVSSSGVPSSSVLSSSISSSSISTGSVPSGSLASSSLSATPTLSAGATSANTGLPTVTQPATPPPADTAAAAAAAASNIALAKDAKADITNVQRFNTLLTKDGAGKELLGGADLQNRLVFDFGVKATANGEGGRFVLANAANFPILVEQGIATAVGFLGPCGMNSPHTHPRATEFLTVVQGQIESGFMLENTFLAGAQRGQLTTQVSSTLGPFQGTVFPQGSIHFQFNPTCEPATFVATLNSDDPGASQVAQNFFFLDEQIVNITLGEVSNIDGKNIEDFRTTLPISLVKAVDSCMAKCGH